MLSYKKNDIKEALRNIKRAKTALTNVQNFVQEPKRKTSLLMENAQLRRAQLQKMHEKITDISQPTSNRESASKNSIKSLMTTKPIQSSMQAETKRRLREIMKRFPMQNTRR